MNGENKEAKPGTLRWYNQTGERNPIGVAKRIAINEIKFDQALNRMGGEDKPSILLLLTTEYIVNQTESLTKGDLHKPITREDLLEKI